MKDIWPLEIIIEFHNFFFLMVFMWKEMYTSNLLNTEQTDMEERGGG